MNLETAQEIMRSPIVDLDAPFQSAGKREGDVDGGDAQTPALQVVPERLALEPVGR